MVQAIRFAKTGGPEVLEWQQVEIGKPGPGQVRLKHSAVGLNYIDTYQRSGLYPMPMPSGLGSEAAGIIEEVGPGVSGLKPGDRVAYAGGPLGAYCEARVMPADRLVPVPDGITRPAGGGDDAEGHDRLVPDPPHPCGQTGRDDPDPRRGRRGRADRLPMGEASGRHRDRHGRRRSRRRRSPSRMAATIRSTTGRRISSPASPRSPGGKKCPVVYDFVGKDTFFKSLDCLAPLGLMALFGQSSGSVPPVDLGILAGKGSLFVTRPTLNTYTATREDLLTAAGDLFEVVLSGAVKIEINQNYPLRNAAQAHRDLQDRKTTGSTVFTV